MFRIFSAAYHDIKTIEEIKNVLVEQNDEYELKNIKNELTKILKKDSVKVSELSNNLYALRRLYTDLGTPIRAVKKYEIILNDVNAALEIIKEKKTKEMEEQERKQLEFQTRVVDYCYDDGVNKIEMLFRASPDNHVAPFCDLLTGQIPDEILTQGRVYAFADQTFSNLNYIFREYEQGQLTEEEAVKKMIAFYLQQFLGGFYKYFDDNFCQIRDCLELFIKTKNIQDDFYKRMIAEAQKKELSDKMISIQEDLYKNYDFPDVSNTFRKKIFTLFDATKEEIYSVIYKCCYISPDMLSHCLEDLFITKFLNYVCRYVCCYRVR